MGGRLSSELPSRRWGSCCPLSGLSIPWKPTNKSTPQLAHVSTLHRSRGPQREETLSHCCTLVTADGLETETDLASILKGQDWGMHGMLENTALSNAQLNCDSSSRSVKWV